MTYTGATIAALVAVLFWYIGWWMKKQEMDMILDFRNVDIKMLQQRICHYENLLESSFNRKEMQEAYTAGSRCNKPQQSFEQWIVDRFGSDAPIEEEKEPTGRKVKYNYPWESGYKASNS